MTPNKCNESLRLLALFAALLVTAWSTAKAEVKGKPWSSGGVVDTGAGYDMASGLPSRTVIDFEVPGAVGRYPLRVARSLVHVHPSTELEFPLTWWNFDFHYELWYQGSDIVARFPAERVNGFEPRASRYL